MRLRITAETIEETHSEQELSFEILLNLPFK